MNIVSQVSTCHHAWHEPIAKGGEIQCPTELRQRILVLFIVPNGLHLSLVPHSRKTCQQEALTLECFLFGVLKFKHGN
jgi:hypothetical protein